MKHLVRFYRKYKVLNKFFFVQVFVFVLLLSSMVIDNKQVIVFMYFIILLLCLLSYYSLYKVYKNISDFVVLEAEAELYEKQQQIQKEHLIALGESKKKLNDCKKELYEIFEVENISIQDEEEARIKANELIQKYSGLFSIDYCQNKIIDAILYNKVLWAKTLGIKITTKMIVPEVIKVEDIDLMFLFTNLIDNAIEACTKVDQSKRYIDVEAMVKTNYLVVRVSNSKDPLVHLNARTIVSTKENREQHGIGLQILKQVCKKNNGEFKIEDQETNVNIYATLSLKEGIT